MIKFYPIIGWLTAVLVATSSFAYQLGMYNMEVPSALERSSKEFTVRHRFYGILTEDPVDNFFGLDQGANVSIGCKYVVLQGLEAEVGYTRDHGEYVAGLAYSRDIHKLNLSGRLGTEFFSFEKTGQSETRENFFYHLVLQGDMLQGRLRHLASTGYDGYNERFGFSLGLSAGLFRNGGVLDEIRVLGEYYPVPRGGGDDSFLGEKNCFAFGVGLGTWGHQFIFMAGNTTEIGMRRVMLGTDSGDLHFGFTIRRLWPGS